MSHSPERLWIVNNSSGRYTLLHECKVQHGVETLSLPTLCLSFLSQSFLPISRPISLLFFLPPSLTLSILHHFNNSKWYIKVNEICHTSGHNDACQGFVSSVRRTAAAHQQPVLLPHQVEYWIGKVLKNTIAPLISTRHNLWRLTSQVLFRFIIFHFPYLLYSDLVGDTLPV